jgi:hypothetical protein
MLLCMPLHRAKHIICVCFHTNGDTYASFDYLWFFSSIAELALLPSYDWSCYFSMLVCFLDMFVVLVQMSKTTLTELLWWPCFIQVWNLLPTDSSRASYLS